MPVPIVPDVARYEIRFASLFDDGRSLVFPCDAEGHVDLDALPPRARANYLYARALVGRDYATPQVLRVTPLADAPPLQDEPCICS